VRRVYLSSPHYVSAPTLVSAYVRGKGTNFGPWSSGQVKNPSAVYRSFSHVPDAAQTGMAYNADIISKALFSSGWEDILRRSNAYFGLGALLVVAGILLLMQNLGVVRFAWDLLWALLFAGGGMAFLSVFAANRTHWWAVIPGFTLLGLAAVVSLTTLFPRLAGAWTGAIFLGAIGLSFWVVYLADRDNWWAMIPGGTLTTLALVAGLSANNDGIELGGLFFLGLAVTFGLVYFLPDPKRRMGWAIIPAIVLGIIGLLMTAAMGGLINFIWPVLLILGGIYLVYRASTRSSRS
jgi:hypothetical protein